MGLSVQYRDFVAADAEKCIEHGAMGRGHGAWGHGAERRGHGAWGMAYMKEIGSWMPDLDDGLMIQ